jgi:hypothetical protein
MAVGCAVGCAAVGAVGAHAEIIEIASTTKKKIDIFFCLILDSYFY